MRLLVLFVGVFVTLQSQCVNAVTEVRIAPSRVTKLVGDNVEFYCMVPKEEGKSIRWSKEDGEGNELINAINSATKPSKYEVDSNPSNDIDSLLRIKNLEREDQGSYYCNYGLERAVGFLEVTYEGLVEIIGNRVIDEKVDMNFTCFVDGSASYEVTWKKNDKTDLPNDKLPRIKIEGSTMVIEKAVDQDRGNYSCFASYNGTDVSARITVGGVLRIKAPKSIKFTEGERARFECIAEFLKGDPEPDFTWYIENVGNETWDSNMEEDGRHEVKHSDWVTGSVLHMTNVVFDDAGNYTCVAKSNVTTVQHTIQLRVRDRLAALWPFIGIMSEVILLIIIIFIHEKCTQGDDIGEEDEEDEAAEPIKEKEKISLDGEGDMRMRTSKP